MNLPSIKDCKDGHCRFHFPQFRGVNAVKLQETLAGIVEKSKDPSSYFVQAYTEYGNVKATVDICNAALALLPQDLVLACSMLQSFELSERAQGRSSYIGADGYYLDLRGGVAQFQPCCR